MPGGVKITSVADRLGAHVSSTRPVAVETSSSDDLPESTAKENQVIVRPVTELSRRALDRYTEKHSKLVKPVTELSRLAMDRWLETHVLADNNNNKDNSNNNEVPDVESALRLALSGVGK